eukprot:GDKH01019799.1.p2 GENE.GDKH01019799.1~~GDKH01019799.1.p2  ORF type:complete len:75 (+),score=4.73 GDKH01019799.1:294-518(+)
MVQSGGQAAYFVCSILAASQASFALSAPVLLLFWSIICAISISEGLTWDLSGIAFCFVMFKEEIRRFVAGRLAG